MSDPEDIKRALSLEKRKQYLFANITKACDSAKRASFDELDAAVSLRSCSSYESTLESLTAEIFCLNENLVAKDKLLTADLDSIRMLIDSLTKSCLKVQAKAAADAVAASVPAQSLNQSGTASVPKSIGSLPMLSVPTFDGDIALWLEFKSQFEQIIDKASIGKSLKLTYLRNSLTNEPLSIVSQYPIDDSSYDSAWDDLKKRYDNQRRTASYYLYKILQFKSTGQVKDKEHIKFIEVHRAATSALKNLKLSDLADFIMFELSYQNLSLSDQKQFDHDHVTSTSLPTVKDLLTYVEGVARSEELRIDKSSLSAASSKIKGNANVRKSLVANSSKPSCFHCEGDHRLYRCPELDNLSVPERASRIRELGCCIACLYKHPNKECHSRYACKLCGSKDHNTILHGLNESALVSSEQSTKSCNWASVDQKNQVLLATILCRIKDVWGQLISVKAVVDPGSEVSIASSTLVRSLGIQKRPATCQIQGITQGVSKSLGNVHLQLYDSSSTSCVQQLEAVVMPSICNQIPNSEVSEKVFQRFSHLKLADDNFTQPANIHLLLGAAAYGDLLSTVEPAVVPGNPCAINTKYGYIILGRVGEPSSERQSSSVVACDSSLSLRITTLPLDATLQKFWETEEVAYVAPEDPADIAAEKHFVNTYKRDEEGRFIVKMPFLPDAPALGSNTQTAIRCLQRLERRLGKNENFKNQYEACINEYIELNHMVKCPEQLTYNYFLPHHAVIKESSSTTKLRVVFNCSSPDDQGLSLNDRLYRGPPLLPDIAALLINFRLNPICLVADVKMMYRMVLVHPDHQKYLSILWSTAGDSQYQRYQMVRLTFGLKPAGFLASRCIVELANLYKDQYPEAAHAIHNERYMDDFCSSVKDLQAARELQRQLTELLAKGGFEIRRWSSNNVNALESIPAANLDTPVVLPSGEAGVKVLGVMWECGSDSFVVNIVNFDPKSISKRSILSYIAKIYDVMGLFCPTIFLAKEFLQRLWLHQLSWDDELPADLAREWMVYANDLPTLSEIKIPRYLPVINCIVRLVGFSDASERGMAAACYIQIEHDARCESYLLKAKSKLAPLKTLTIPKLELCAALMLAQLIKSILQDCKLHYQSINLFSDSRIVLSWINQPLHEMKIFIANRVSQIHQLTSKEWWSHVPGISNPADLASRGALASHLQNSELWWHGADFLRSHHDHWPIFNRENLISPEDLPEMKTTVNTALLGKVNDGGATSDILDKFSSFSQLQRVLAYVLRFISNIRNPEEKTVGPLLTRELESAVFKAVFLSQQRSFHSEMSNIAMERPVSNQLQKLSPFIDPEAGLIRVGGRMRHASFLPKSAKHPLLLDKGCHLSTLICRYNHLIMLHSGPRSTCARIQRKFWIISVTSLVKKVINRCTVCHRFNAKPNQPIMADVLPDRMRMTHAFAGCALDFGGPFMVKESNLRKSARHKAYICVFVCLTTRAIHIEMVTDLTAKAFLAAFYRFTARRSVPDVIYSDRGTNITATRAILKDCTRFLLRNHDVLFSAAAAVGTRWLLNAPYAPNFNGCAENGIKSCKALIKRQIGLRVLTFEEFTTLLCRVEQVLNSRPISFSNDINDRDLVYLTPGHFLTGREMMTPPEEKVEDNINLVDRWKIVQQMSQVFWRKWSTVYLHELMQRRKWTKASTNLKPGDLVYVKGVDTTPLSWPIGKVEEVYRSPSDSTVRVVRVRCRDKDFVRPVSKLIIIPTEDENAEL